MEIKCPICDRVREINKDSYRRAVKRNTLLCRNCSAKLSAQKVKSHKQEEINNRRLEVLKKELSERDLVLMRVLGEEIPCRRNNTIPLEVKCEKCDHTWLDTSAHLINDKKGCPICMTKISNTKRSETYKTKEGKYPKNKLKAILDSRGLELMDENILGKISEKVKVRCKRCGRVYEVRICNIVYHNYSCPNCKSVYSKGELLIKDILDKNKIEYAMSYRFKDCRYKNPLPFDFYLPKYNCCIEYQGCQHYNEKEYAKLTRGTNRNGGFESYQKRDQIKRDYCKSKDILYIEVFEYQTPSEIREILGGIWNG